VAVTTITKIEAISALTSKEPEETTEKKGELELVSLIAKPKNEWILA